MKEPQEIIRKIQFDALKLGYKSGMRTSAALIGTVLPPQLAGVVARAIQEFTDTQVDKILNELFESYIDPTKEPETPAEEIQRAIDRGIAEL